MVKNADILQNSQKYRKNGLKTAPAWRNPRSKKLEIRDSNLGWWEPKCAGFAKKEA